VVGLLRQGSRGQWQAAQVRQLVLSCKRIDQRPQGTLFPRDRSEWRLKEEASSPRRHCHCHGTPPLENLSREGAAQIKLGSAANIFSSHTSTVPAVDRKVRGRSEVRMEDLIASEG
jgi:hypothetical protein